MSAKWVLAVLAVIAVVVAAATIFGPSTPAVLSGNTLDGQFFDITSYRGKRAVINIFAEWCPPCNAEARDLVAFCAAHPEVGFVGVDTRDVHENGERFVAQYGITYPVVFDPDGTLGRAFKIEGIPTTIFLDSNGIERERISGSARLADFEKALKAAE